MTPAPEEHPHNADVSNAGNHRYHDHEHVNELAHGGHDRPGEFHRERRAHDHEQSRPQAAAAAVGVCSVRNPMAVLLVFGGGALPVADPAGNPVDGAGTPALHTAAALAPQPHLHPGTGAGVWPGWASAGVLLRGAGLSAGVVPAAARAAALLT